MVSKHKLHNNTHNLYLIVKHQQKVIKQKIISTSKHFDIQTSPQTIEYLYLDAHEMHHMMTQLSVLSIPNVNCKMYTVKQSTSSTMNAHPL